jgi:hypothetical protein
LKKGSFFSISIKKNDKGVAEVVGAILIFAVLITLFTSFMVWYIPAQTTANETHYEVQNKAALGTMVSNLHSPSITTGSTISSTVPLGIAGVAIFSQATDTQFSILPQDTGFNASVSAVLLLNLTNTSGVISSHFVNFSYNITGLMGTLGSTEYITAINYLIEDGTLFQVYGNNQPSDSLGPLPLGITGSAATPSVSLVAMGITGQSEIFSSTSSEVVNLLVNTSTFHDFSNGSIVAFSGKEYTIDNMSLHSLKYTFNGAMANAWNYAFFSQYNSSRIPFDTLVSLSGWNFTGLPFAASSLNTSFSISLQKYVSLNSFNSQYLTYRGD